LEETAQKERLAQDNVKALDLLKEGLQADVPADLSRYEASIRKALEQELVVHLYNATGRYQHGLMVDPVSLRAVALLESNEAARILEGPLNP
jgi:hypothetical protein